jgi:ATP-dependent RNA helicase DOB1
MGGDGLYLVVDEKTTFREDNFQKAVNAVSSSGTAKKENGKFQKLAGKRKDDSGPSDIFKLVKMIMLRQYDPVIVFCFSKRDCEAQAVQVLVFLIFE